MIAGLYNFRDIGGIPATGGIIRPNFVYRSAQPGEITQEGAETLLQLGIKTIFDLRSAPESSRYEFSHVKEIHGIRRVAVPVFTSTDTSQEISKRRNYALGQPGFDKMYHNILTSAGGAFTPIFQYIRDRPTEACLIHCSLGRDRTGLLVALILKLAGADDESILADYERSNEGLAPWRESLSQVLVKDDPWLGEQADALETMLSVRRSYLQVSLEWICSEYGGVEGFLIDVCGLTKEDLVSIKVNLVRGTDR